MKAQYQVVAVYPSGRRFPVRAPHDSFDGALWHKEACERFVRECEPDERQDINVYEIDVVRVAS